MQRARQSGDEVFGVYHPDSWMFNPAVERLPFDLDRASALLDEAGWQVDEEREALAAYLVALRDDPAGLGTEERGADDGSQHGDHCVGATAGRTTLAGEGLQHQHGAFEIEGAEVLRFHRAFALAVEEGDEATVIVVWPEAQGIIQASWNWPIAITGTWTPDRTPCPPSW